MIAARENLNIGNEFFVLSAQTYILLNDAPASERERSIISSVVRYAYHSGKGLQFNHPAIY